LNWEVSGEFWSNLGVLNEADVKSFVKLLKDSKALTKAKQMPLGPDGKPMTSFMKRGSAVPDAYLFSLAPPTADKEALTYRINETKIYKFQENDHDRIQIQLVSSGEPPVKSILD